MSDIRNRLLTMLNEELQEAEDFEEVSLFTKDELEAPVDVVRGMIVDIGTELIPALTEFFFLPYEDEDMLYFSTLITITDEIQKDELADLSMAVARLNFDIPCGAFSISPDGESLVYKYTVPFPGDLDEEGQKTMMLTAVDAAINIVDAYEGYLALVLEGNLTADKMIDLVRGKQSNDADSADNTEAVTVEE